MIPWTLTGQVGTGWCEGRMGVSGEGPAGGIKGESKSSPYLTCVALAMPNTLDE